MRPIIPNQPRTQSVIRSSRLDRPALVERGKAGWSLVCSTGHKAGGRVRRGLLETASGALKANWWTGLAIGLLPVAATAQEVLPSPTSASPVFVGRTASESGPPTWPKTPVAPAGAPNVLVIMTDDVGFAASASFGGQIPTPAFDRVAQAGLRYNQFNTSAICSATRGALLTGREPHNINVANANNLSTGYEGYNTVIPKSAGTIAEVLKQRGYNTAAFGKWHLTPEWEESQTGPFDRWPTGMGFEYYYGFLGADASQWSPAIIEGTTPIELPHDNPNYILDRDMADRAIGWIRQQHEIAPAKPFFLYFTPGSAHAPHHAPKEWLEKFRGKFDQGWDVLRQQTFTRQKSLGVIPATAELTPRPAFLPAWASLNPDQKRLYARQFEAFAAQLSFADHQIGRIIDDLRNSGQFDNTLIFYIQGDNGASAEGGLRGLLFEQSFINRYEEDPAYVLRHIDDIGGPNAFNHFHAAWGWATTSPFQYYKQVASHFGGIRNGLAISWPAKIKDVGGLRQQFHHVSDIAPTILEATGIAAPTVLNGVAQQPLDGISLAYSFAGKDVPSRRKTQVFETIQNLGIYHDGWWAGTRPAKAPWELTKGLRPDLNTRIWELYNVEKDFSQAHDLAASNPAKMAQMQQLFWAEAGRNHILPIHDISEGIEGRPSLTEGRTRFVYNAGLTRLPENAAPHTIGRSFEIDAEIVVPETGADGVLVAHGGRFGGYSFYVRDGRPVFHYNAIGERQYRIVGDKPLSAGPHMLKAVFKADSKVRGAGGTLIISVDGKPAGQGRIDNTIMTWISHSEGFDVGSDTITPVSDEYSVRTSRFTGVLTQVVFTLR